MPWIAPNPNHAIWKLEGSPFVVIAWQDRRTLSVARYNSLGNLVTLRNGFRSLRTAQAHAERLAKK